MKRLFQTTFVDEVRLKALTQVETELLLDTLSLIAAVDGNVSPLEFASMTSGIDYLNWHREDLSCGAYMEARMNFHVRNRSEKKHIREFCSMLAGELSEPWLRETLYVCAGRLAMVDETLSPSEARMQDLMAEAFGFSGDHRAQLDERFLKVDS